MYDRVPQQQQQAQATSSNAADPDAQFREKQMSEIDALVNAFPDGQVPESSLGNALNNMAEQWTSILSQVVTEVDHTQPIPEHIKETAEFAVKQFRDACLEMNSQLTRISMNWQLKNPEEMTKQVVSDYESAIQRQKNLLEKIRQKIDEDLNPTLF